MRPGPPDAPSLSPVAPMLAFLASGPFDSAEHLFELKWDGVRTVACLEKDGAVRLFSRRLHEVTALYPELDEIAREVDPALLPAVFDGEIVCLRDGKPSFEALQHRFTARDARTIAEGRRRFPVAYVVFDLLVTRAESIMPHPLLERRKRLAAGLATPSADADPSPAPDSGPAPSPVHRGLVYSEAVEQRGRLFAEAVFAQGLEGVMAKEKDSPYQPGRRSRAWLKIKRPALERFLIGAANFHPGGRLASVEVGRLSPLGDLEPLGAVGSGIGEGEARRLVGALLPLEQGESPFSGPLPQGGPFRRSAPDGGKLVRLWVRPALSCLVEYLERTESGALRHPVYKGELRKEG